MPRAGGKALFKVLLLFFCLWVGASGKKTPKNDGMENDGTGPYQRVWNLLEPFNANNLGFVWWDLCWRCLGYIDLY